MNKFLKILLIAAAVAAAVFVILIASVAIPAMTAPVLTEEEAAEYILESVQPQIDKIKEDFDIPDLRVTLNITSYEVEKPAFYRNGNFFCEGQIKIVYYDRFYSDSFSEIDETSDPEKLKQLYYGKYNKIPKIDYSFRDKQYRVSAERNYDYGSRQYYCTPNNNSYDFGEYNIYKNGENICEIRSVLPAEPANRNPGEKCIICNGSGYVKYYYGSSDLEAILSGHDPYTTGKCTSCGGTGRDNKK